MSPQADWSQTRMDAGIPGGVTASCATMSRWDGRHNVDNVSTTLVDA